MSAKCDKDYIKLDLPENLNSYIVVYRLIAPSGVIEMSQKKIEIKSKNKQNAIIILRKKLGCDDEGTIRIDRIEQVSRKKEPEKKRKRSVFTLVAFAILILAGSARLLSRLF